MAQSFMQIEKIIPPYPYKTSPHIQAIFVHDQWFLETADCYLRSKPTTLHCLRDRQTDVLMSRDTLDAS